MTLVGKIFTGFIFVMSVMYMTGAIFIFATHTNWKEKATQLDAEYKNQNQINEQLKTQLEQLKSRIAMEQAARRFLLASLQTKFTEAEKQLVERQKQLETLTAAETKNSSALDVASKQLADLTGEVAGLRTEIARAYQNVDTTLARVVEVTDQNNQSQRTQAELMARNQPLERQVAAYQQILNKMGIKNEAQPDGTVVSNVDREPPSVEGEIREVQKDLVQITIGDDDGLLVGHELDVYRSNTYLGRVVVLQTGPDGAVAKVIPGFSKGQMRKGDRVATRISS